MAGVRAPGRAQGYFHFAEKKGYSGVAAYTRLEPSDVIVGFDGGEFDAEGRWVELRFDTPSASIPSSAATSQRQFGGERQQAKYRFLDRMYPHLQRLKAERDFILCGDVNIAHQQADLKNWRSNQKNSGFLPEERAWMTRLTGEGGIVDVPPPVGAHQHRYLLHMVEQPRPDLCPQRGVAPGLPPTPTLAAAAHAVTIYKTPSSPTTPHHGDLRFQPLDCTFCYIFRS